MIPYGRQELNQEDIDAVIKVLESDFITQGPKVPLFEKNISKYCNVEYSVATNSATSALHIACLALGLCEGDYLWTSPNTFVASANCGLYCGAKVDFVDIDPHTFCMSVTLLEKKLQDAERNNKLPKIVIPVHFAGQSCDMKRIHELSLKYGFRIIEDAAHAIGAKYLGEPVGNCKFSDIAVFSFHPVKIITTAEGGIATTNQKKLFKKMQILRSHGITRNPEMMTNTNGSWYYEQIELGYNYRMTDLQAALGVSQMKRLDTFIERRHQIKKRYDELLSGLPIIKPFQSKDSFSALHLYPIQIILEETQKTHFQIFKELRDSGIGVNLHYIPVHTQPYYKKMGFNEGDFPNAENYYRKALSIPIFYSLSKESQNKVIASLTKVLN